MTAQNGRTTFPGRVQLLNDSDTLVGGVVAFNSATPGAGVTDPRPGMFGSGTDGQVYYYSGGWQAIGTGTVPNPLPIDTYLNFGATSGDNRARVGEITPGIFQLQSYGPVSVESKAEASGISGNIGFSCEAGAGSRGGFIFDGRFFDPPASAAITANQSAAVSSLPVVMTFTLVGTQTITFIAPFTGRLINIFLLKETATGGGGSQVAWANVTAPTTYFTIPLNGTAALEALVPYQVPFTAAPTFTAGQTLSVATSGTDPNCTITLYFQRTA